MSSLDIDPRLRGTSSNSQQPASTQPSYRQATSIAPHPPSSSASPLQYQPSHNTTPLQHQHQQSFLSQTPQSTGNVADRFQSDTPEGGQADVKRPRACEACRGLKVKCEPDPNNEEGPCKRCAKSNRNCIVTQPSRKRQKKADSRVAELEKKIEDLQALTAVFATRPAAAADNNVHAHNQQPLHAQAAYPQGADGGFGRNENPYPARSQSTGNDWGSLPKAGDLEANNKGGVPMVVAAGKSKRKYVEDSSAAPGAFFAPNDGKHLFEHVQSIWSLQMGKKNSQTHIYSDIIDRGLIAAETAYQTFDFYVKNMAPHLPSVVFPPGTTAASVRKEKPILFLAILTVGAGPTNPALQHALAKETMTIYAERIIIKAEKSLELIQALTVSTLWYYPPEHFEELNFYQLIHVAAVMAIDIGLGKANKSTGGRSGGFLRDIGGRQLHPDSESLEARRAWLTSYFMCCLTSMGLRRPNLIRWSPFMADCVKVLETSPDAYASDKSLCAWVRSQHLAEEVGYEFSMDDPSAKVSLSDDKVSYALKKFEQDLETWRAEVPIEARSDSLEMTGHVLSIYMHEIAMHVDHNVEEFRPPYNEDTIQGLLNPPKVEALTTTHVRALSQCLNSIDSVFDVFLKHSVEVVRCLPVANFVRVAYAAVVLIKISLAAAHPNSGIGKIFVQSNLRVDEQLDGLIHLLSGAAADNKSRPSSKFMMILVMLKTWFNRRAQGGKNSTESPPNSSSAVPSSEQAGDGQTRSYHRASGPPQQKQAYPACNTPLQVLSDVATGNSREQSRVENQYTAVSTSEWQQNPMQTFQSYHVESMQQQGFAAAGNIDPSFGMPNMDYTMGDGFETAMGFTLAGLGTYLGDDAFFNGMMNAGYGGYGMENF